MSTTLTGLPYTRFVRQVCNGPSAVINAAALAEVNAIMLKSAEWVESAETAATMPPLNMVTNPLLPTYDAFKYGSDYVAGTRNAYAGMVAYRFTVPADAIAKASTITSIALSLYADRWLLGGCRVAAYTSDSKTPSETWATLREGSVYVSDAIEAAPDPRVDQNATATLTFAVAPTADAYIWVILTLEDYESVSPLDVRRIEGGALIVGQASSVVFSADNVAEDVVVDTDSIVSVPDGNSADPYEYSGGLTYGQRADLAGFPRMYRYMQAVFHGNPEVFNSTSPAYRSSIGLKVHTFEGNPTVYLDAQWHTMAIAPGLPRTVSRLSFANAIPTPSPGVVIFIAVYLCAYDDADLYVTNAYLDVQTRLDRKLWIGEASTAVFSIGEVVHTTTATLLWSSEITTGIPAGTDLPCDATLPQWGRLLVCAHPIRITSDPGSTLDTLYGISWLPGNITLKP